MAIGSWEITFHPTRIPGLFFGHLLLLEGELKTLLKEAGTVTSVERAGKLAGIYEVDITIALAQPVRITQQPDGSVLVWRSLERWYTLDGVFISPDPGVDVLSHIQQTEGILWKIPYIPVEGTTTLTLRMTMVWYTRDPGSVVTYDTVRDNIRDFAKRLGSGRLCIF